MEQLIWISYDLGVDGDYNSLYYWLDSHNARECGDSVAAITNYKYNEDIVSEIKQDIKENVELRKTDRIYLVYKSEEDTLKGKFIFGKRKRSPWEGYSSDYEGNEEDE